MSWLTLLTLGLTVGYISGAVGTLILGTTGIDTEASNNTGQFLVQIGYMLLLAVSWPVIISGIALTRLRS